MRLPAVVSRTLYLVLRALTMTILLGLVAASAASAQGTGYWHTGGAQIYDSNNQLVRIAGINWYGFETTDLVAHGLSNQDYKIILDTIKNDGYNTVRLPFSNQVVETPGTNLNITYWANFGPANTDLQGLNSLQVLDHIVTYAGTIGLKVILDNHRSEAGNSAEASGLWYTGAYPESNWIADWQALATRYLGNPTVIGMDLRNEPHNAYSGGACWDCGGANDWHLAAARAGNAVLAINPNLLIFVEGNDAYNNDFYWWGGNLEGVATSPVTLSVPNRLVYSAHDYGPNEYAQTWFSGSTTPASLAVVWTKHWAYLSQQGTAPVWVGEFGTENQDIDVQSSANGSQGQWFSSLVGFLKSNPAVSWTYWALNGEDSYGLLDYNYDATPVDALKQTTLASIQFPLNISASTPASTPQPPSGLVASAASSSQIKLAWTASTTTGVTYTAFFGTSAGSVGTVLASGLTSPGYQATGLNSNTTYYFDVEAVSSGGNSTLSNTASATTQGPSTTSAPGTPTATAVSPSQISLTWIASASGQTYSVYSGTSAAAVTNPVASGISGTSYTVSSLSASTTYYFTIVGVTSTATSLPSGVGSATTLASATPSAPSGLSASSASASSINLSWQPSSTSGVTYTVYRGTASGVTSTVVASGLSGQNAAVNNLQDNTTYYFTVKAVTSAGLMSVASNQASATTQTLPATTPTGLTAATVSSSQINLSWSAVANTGATYAVYSGTTSGAENTLLATGLSATSYQATGLTASTTYYFIVRSISGGGTSSPSTQVSATTQAVTVPVTPPTTPPAAPNALTATAASSVQINLAWSPSTTSGVTYTVFNGSTAIASGLASTSYSVTGLTPNTLYSFSVVAVSSAGSSAASNSASATTLGAAVPGAPSGLVATVVSSSQINLGWTASATTSVTYTVYSGLKSGAETTMVASGITGTAYSVNGLSAGTQYFFIVKAVAPGSTATTSGASNEASATTQSTTAGGCHVAYLDQNDWGTGFTGNPAITNSGSTAWTSWNVTWTYGGNQQIIYSWNGSYTQTGPQVSISSASWNGAVAAGATVATIGWNANYSGTNANPTIFSVNGVACH